MHLAFGFLIATFLALPTQLQAVGSGDVCCFGYAREDGKITTFALPQSATTCKAGGKDAQGGRTICGSDNNLDSCASKSSKDICTACGFFWNDEGVCTEKKLVPEDKDKEKADKKDDRAPKK